MPGDRLLARAVERSRRGRSGLYDVTVSRLDSTGTPSEVLAEFRGRDRGLCLRRSRPPKAIAATAPGD